MIPRYATNGINEIFGDAAKVQRWDMVELAVIKARVEGLATNDAYIVIAQALHEHPCNIMWWLNREKETKHDLAAYVDERMRYIPIELQHHFHKDMTSYDTEDPAFTLALRAATKIVIEEADTLQKVLVAQAKKHGNVVMFDRTHGQGAKLRTVGGRILTWYAPLERVVTKLEAELRECAYSRISGAIGNYGGGMTPEIEQKALKTLELMPFYGATQILPRVMFMPLAQALGNVAEVIAQIAMDFRLGARSGTPLWHEPFGAKQKGSSAMPHKKNPINTEQMGGMLNLVRGNVHSLQGSVQTWEGRAIEQSCVERVAWPDLFHCVLRMITVMRKVLERMVVYPDNMLAEIHAARGTYASDEAKNFLAAECGKIGVPFETAYRIIQLASFNTFRPSDDAQRLRNTLPSDIGVYNSLIANVPTIELKNIRDIIMNAELVSDSKLDASDAQDVVSWNKLLRRIFESAETQAAWRSLFTPQHLLRHEGFLFEKLVDE